MDKLVIVPTYNERENIHPLIEKVLSLPEKFDLLIVDDNSPDGTADVVKAWQAKSDRVHMLQRPGKMGLGSAYRDGFQFALSHGAEYILEMDADFSHDPGVLGEFIKNMQDVDIVLGSRYLHGVTVVNWPLSRLILSYSANAYTRIITGLPLADATGGFKCFRRRALEGISLEKVKSEGYSFQIEISYRCWRRGFRIKEIPILFTDRRVGVSKMSRRIIWEAAGMVWRLRFLDLLGQLE